MAAEVFALNALAGYACRHSGACCTAGWTIPVEPRLLPIIGVDWLEPDDDGACPRYDRRAQRCELHRDHGEASIPASCHHFPRRALIDDRGASVTLSLFCPTAAALLLDSAEPLRVVPAPPAFPATRGYEGLDARDEWPPLLTRDVLFDLESFTLWERYLVDTLSSSSLTVDQTLLAVAARAESLRTWSIDAGSLAAWTRAQLAPEADGPGVAPAVHARYAPFTGVAAFRHAVDAVPPGLTRPLLPDAHAEADATWVTPQWPIVRPRVLRVLGAKAFASWTAYQSRGIRTQIAELFLTAAVLRLECVRACHAAQRPLDTHLLLDAVRQTDLLLVHLVDRDLLLPWLGKAELDAPDVARTR